MIGWMMGDGMLSGSARGWYLDRVEEERRRRAVQRARREEKRWLSLVLKTAGKERKEEKWRAFIGCAARVLLWLFLGIGALGLSGALWSSTGVEHMEQTEGPSLLLDEGDEADWEREFFGVRIQLRSGQITIFREKEEGVRVQ